MFKNHFLKGGLAALFLCSVVQTAAAATLQKPTEGWRVKPISAKQGDEPAYCAMKNSFKGGTAMIVARETTGDNAIALDFHKNKFKPGIRYNVKARAGAATRDIEALAASKQVLILQMGADPEFFKALAQEHSATFTAGKNTYGFELDASAADALTALGHCAASLKVGMTFTEAAFPLGISNEKSAKKVAAKAESIDVPLDNAAAKPAVNDITASDITASTSAPASIDAQPGSTTAAEPVTEVSALNAKPVVSDITATEKTAENKAPEKAAAEKTPTKTKASAKVGKAPKTDSDKSDADKVASVKAAADKTDGEKVAVEKTAAAEGDKIADHVEKIAKGEMAYDIPADERPAPSKKRRNKQAKKNIIEDILPSSSAQPYVQVTREPQQPSEQMVDMVRDDIKTEIASELLALSGAAPLAPLPPESGPAVTSMPVPPVEASSITSAKTAPETKAATEAETAAFTAPATGNGFSMDTPATPSGALAKDAKQKTGNVSKPSSQAELSNLTQLQEEAIAGLRATVALKEAQIERMQAALHGKTDEMQTVLMEKEKSLAAAELAISNNNKALAEAHAVIASLKSQQAALLQEKEPAAGELQQQEMAAEAPAAAYDTPPQRSRVGSLDLKGLLLSSRDITDKQIKISDNGNALHWASGGLFGSAQKSPNTAGKSLKEAADDYLRKTASLCKGDFGHKLNQVKGDGKLNMLEADITCVDGQHNAAAAVLFISSNDMFSVITEEGTIDQLHTAMTNRDAFVSAALGNAAPAGGINVNFGGPQRKLPPLVAEPTETVSH